MSGNDWSQATYKETVTHTPEAVYKDRLQFVLTQYQDRIVDFRPPEVGEYFVEFSGWPSSVVGLVYYGAVNWGRDSGCARFILSPPEEVVGEYKLEILNRPPKIGEYYNFDNQNPPKILTRTGGLDESYKEEHTVRWVKVK